VVLASLAAAGAQASVTLVVFLALRVPGAFVAAGIVFVLAWLPMIGITPVYAVGAGWLFHEHGIVQVLLLVAGGFAAGVADNIVRPAVLGGRHQMHPLVSLVAIFGGIATFGLFGVLVGPILAAVFIALLDTWPIVARHCGIQVSETGTVPELDAPQEPPRRP
jgi:predicted PurR-regulated permease PerM